MIRIETVVPPQLKLDAMYEVLEKQMEAYGKFILRDFQGVVQPWSNPKPSFSLEMEANPQFIEIRVVGGGSEEGRKKWIFVDQGTRAHTIRAKGGGVLAFPSVYHSGSTPGKKFTTKGTSSGDTVYAREVHHPGTEARDFTGTILADHEKPLASWMKAAMSQAARASGHGR